MAGKGKKGQKNEKPAGGEKVEEAGPVKKGDTKE